MLVKNRTKRTIKVFGERNTGTRALKRMLQNAEYIRLQQGTPAREKRNNTWCQLRDAIDRFYKNDWHKLYMDALRDDNEDYSEPIYAWKHAAPIWDITFLKHQIDVIFMVRNPYSWVLSMALKPYHIKGPRVPDFVKFINRPWLTERRDNVPVVLSSVLDLWNKKLSAYREFARTAQHFGTLPQYINFESFVQNPKDSVQEVLSNLGISSSGVIKIDKSTKRDGKTLSNIQEYYGHELWKQRLTQEAVQQINERLDWDLVHKYGYTRLNPADFPKQLSELEQRRFSYEMMALAPQTSRDINSHGKAGTASTT